MQDMRNLRRASLIQPKVTQSELSNFKHRRLSANPQRLAEQQFFETMKEEAADIFKKTFLPNIAAVPQQQTIVGEKELLELPMDTPSRAQTR